jgi:hypothetical protein
MNERNLSKDSSTFLSIAPVLPAAKRCALAIVIALFVVFCALIPFAHVSLPRIEALIPIFDSIVALNNLVTAGLLLVGYSRSRLRAVLLLAGGYLFTALIAVAHLLISPGLFASSALLGASPQTGAWLDTFRNAGFPVSVICYGLLKLYQNKGGQSRANTRICIISVAASAVAGVCLLFLLATAGHPLLPRIVNGENYTSATVIANAPVLLLCLTALTVLGSRFPYSILDLWLLVVICAWMPDVVLSNIINAGRFDLGFAAGHLYGVFAASIVPVVLLVEASRLTGRLDEAIAVGPLRSQRNATHNSRSRAKNLLKPSALRLSVN